MSVLPPNCRDQPPVPEVTVQKIETIWQIARGRSREVETWVELRGVEKRTGCICLIPEFTGKTCEINWVYDSWFLKLILKKPWVLQDDSGEAMQESTLTGQVARHRESVESDVCLRARNGHRDWLIMSTVTRTLRPSTSWDDPDLMQIVPRYGPERMLGTPDELILSATRSSKLCERGTAAHHPVPHAVRICHACHWNPAGRACKKASAHLNTRMVTGRMHIEERSFGMQQAEIASTSTRVAGSWVALVDSEERSFGRFQAGMCPLQFQPNSTLLLRPVQKDDENKERFIPHARYFSRLNRRGVLAEKCRLMS
ncbi:hypothetical protein C8R44DRAFT_726595 [Mycena epipterygia]|nr:hypothetical protein C8R44DRAFT_726595 [Mycena epipterygia]